MLARKAGRFVVAAVSIGSLVVLCAPPGQADHGRRMTARLSGLQEVPANMSPGTGTFEARVEGDRITFALTYADLTTPPTMAHIHLGQRNVNGGIFTFLCGGGGKPACPPAPATVRGSIAAADILALPTQNLAAGNLEAALRAIRRGITYVNVHTTNSPAGEIRGQVRPDFPLGGILDDD